MATPLLGGGHSSHSRMALSPTPLKGASSTLFAKTLVDCKYAQRALPSRLALILIHRLTLIRRRTLALVHDNADADKGREICLD